MKRVGQPSKPVNAARLARRGESPDIFVVREASPSDIPALAQLQVDTWNATYSSALGRLLRLKPPPVEVRLRQWNAAFAETRDWFCLVVEHPSGRLLGFAKAGVRDDEPGTGELEHIYLRREYQRLGLGSRLVRETARRLRARGMRRMICHGYPPNPSYRFFEVLGGSALAANEPWSGSYRWDDLTVLLPNLHDGTGRSSRTQQP